MIGFTSVTFRKYDIEKVVDIAKINNIHSIEWGEDVHVKNTADAKRAKKLCDDNKITVSSYGSYFKIGSDKPSDFEEMCKIAEILNAPIIRVWLGEKGSEKTSDEEYKALVSDTRQIAETAQKYNQTIAFEFHQNTYNDNGKSCIKFINDCGMANVKTYWQPFFKGNDSNNLRTVFPYTVNIHVFFWNTIGKRFTLKKGKSEWSKWIEIAKESGYNGNYTMEFCKRDSKRIFAKDVKTLNSILGD